MGLEPKTTWESLADGRNRPRRRLGLGPQARSVSGRIAGPGRPTVPAAIPGGGIAEEIVLGTTLTLLGTVFAAYGFAMLPARTTEGWLGLAVGLLAATGGLRGLSAPIRYRRALADAVYAVTTERAVMVNGLGRAHRARLCRLADTDRSFHYATVRGRTVKRHRRDGSGDIVFDSEWRRGRRHRYRVEIGFFGVAEVDRVDAHLDAIRPGPRRFDLGWRARENSRPLDGPDGDGTS